MSAGEKPARATSFLRLAFESFEANEANKASLLTTYQTIQKSLVLFSKESDMS